MKKRAVRPNLGAALRPRAKAPRRNFLWIEVTEHEQKRIQDYCIKNHISVSHFLAELLLDDASKPKRTDKVVLRLELEFTPEEQEKLELLGMLYAKSSLAELIRELIQPTLQTQHLHSNRKTTAVRFYLSQEEHQKIATHIAAKRIPIGKYATLLALKEIERDRPKPK